MTRIDTLIVARDQAFRIGFAAIIGTQSSVVGSASLEHALGEIERGLRPRLLIVEAGAIDLEALQQIRVQIPTVKTVVLVDPDHADQFTAPMHFDIDGCLPTDMSPETLKLSLGLIMAGQTVMPSKLARAMYSRRMAATPRTARRILTPRECDVLHLLSLGKMTKEIARQLGLSAATVKLDLKVLLGKLNVSNRTEAAVWAVAQLA